MSAKVFLSPAFVNICFGKDRNRLLHSRIKNEGVSLFYSTRLIQYSKTLNEGHTILGLHEGMAVA